MSTKTRLTVTIDPDLVDAGAEAVAEGRSSSLSAWVNAALAERVVHDRRLRALGEANAAYEDEFGVITADEITRQQRADRSAARVVRPAPRARRSKKPGAA
jgi:hypothetical protein